MLPRDDLVRGLDTCGRSVNRSWRKVRQEKYGDGREKSFGLGFFLKKNNPKSFEGLEILINGKFKKNKLDKKSCFVRSLRA